MAFSSSEIKNWLGDHPGLSDKQIAQAMDHFGVDVYQMADATGVPLADVMTRYEAATKPSDAKTVTTATTASTTPAEFNLGMLGMGDAPKQAYQQMLSGKANTETLDPVVNSAMRRMSDNFNEQVMPNINHGAVASGQYGGSRHGVAQGLAAKGLALAQGDTAANMYNSAYNQAQGLMGSAASQLGGIAGQYGLSNAQMANQTSMFNAGQANQIGMFNAGQANQVGMFNAGQQNNMNQFLANNDLNWANYDLGLYNANNNWALQGANLMNNTYNAMNNANNNAYDAASTAYNQPYNMWSGFTNTANQVGSGFPSSSSSMPGNPVIGAAGGAYMGNQFYNWMNKP